MYQFGGDTNMQSIAHAHTHTHLSISWHIVGAPLLDAVSPSFSCFAKLISYKEDLPRQLIHLLIHMVFQLLIPVSGCESQHVSRHALSPISCINNRPGSKGQCVCNGPRAGTALSSALNMRRGEKGCLVGRETSSNIVRATYIHLRREKGCVWTAILHLINRHI